MQVNAYGLGLLVLVSWLVIAQVQALVRASEENPQPCCVTRSLPTCQSWASVDVSPRSWDKKVICCVCIGYLTAESRSKWIGVEVPSNVNMIICASPRSVQMTIAESRSEEHTSE